MVKALALLGSARRKGNTDLLLQCLINGLIAEGAEVETIRLSSLEIKPCLNCGGCDNDGICVQKDDMMGIFEKLLDYDIIILASPIYFMGISGWAKAMIDRCQSLWVRKYVLNQVPERSRKSRKGVFVSVSGMKKSNVFNGAKLTAQSFFATIHVAYVGNLLFAGIDAKGDIEKHPTALAHAEKLGHKLITEFDNPDFKFDQDTNLIDSEHDRA